jgi:hypothetical protein
MARLVYIKDWEYKWYYIQIFSLLPYCDLFLLTKSCEKVSNPLKNPT